MPIENRFSEDKIDQLVCSDHKKRPIHIWQPEKPKAVMLAIHGGLAHGGDWVTPALHFKKSGWATVALDQHGHDGQEKVHIPSFETFLDDIELFIKDTKQRYPDLPIVILSHSMGALIATHFVLRRSASIDATIRGVIMSSPYFGNAVKVAKPLLMLAGPLAAVLPSMTAPTELNIDQLTHDEKILARHRQDEKDNIRASKLSTRFGHELMKAQEYLAKKGLSGFSKPVFMVVAGTDYLADAKVTEELSKQIDSNLLEYHYYPDNLHENFNELNREAIFKLIEDWAKSKLHL